MLSTEGVRLLFPPFSFSLQFITILTAGVGGRMCGPARASVENVLSAAYWRSERGPVSLVSGPLQCCWLPMKRKTMLVYTLRILSAPRIFVLKRRERIARDWVAIAGAGVLAVVAFPGVK